MADLGISISLDSAQFSAQLRAVTQQTEASTRAMSNAIGGVALANRGLVTSGQSLSELDKRYKALSAQIRTLSPDTQEFINTSAELRLVGDRINQVERAVRGVSTASGQGVGFLSAFTGGLGSLGQVLSGGAIAATGQLAASAVMAIGSAMKEFASESVQVASKVQTVNRALAFTAGGADLGAQAYDRFKATANELGLSIEANQVAYKNFIVSATQSGQTLKVAEEEFKGVATAITGMGLSADDSNGVLLALGQIASKGTVAAEELRGQIGERLPGAFTIAARSIGVTESKLNDMLKQGEVVSKDFLPKFAAELQKTFGSAAQESVNSYTATVNRFNNQIFELKNSIGNLLVSALTEAYKAADVLFKLFTNNTVVTDITKQSSALKVEKDNLNILVGAITDANIKQETRNTLISELQAKYPSFLGSLKAEAVSNEQLGTRLNEVNGYYLERIRLQVANESTKKTESEIVAITEKQLKLAKETSTQLENNKKAASVVSSKELIANYEEAARQIVILSKKRQTQLDLDLKAANDRLKKEQQLNKDFVNSLSKGAQEAVNADEKRLKDAAARAARINEESSKEYQKSLKKQQQGAEKAASELAKIGEKGSLGFLENQLKTIQESFQTKKLSSSDITDLLGKKEDLEEKIKLLKIAFGIIEAPAALGSLDNLTERLQNVRNELRKIGDINANSGKIDLLLSTKSELETQIELVKKAIGEFDKLKEKLKEIEKIKIGSKEIRANQSAFGNFTPQQQDAIPQAANRDLSGILAEFNAVNEALLKNDDAIRGGERALNDYFQTLGLIPDKAADVASSLAESFAEIKKTVKEDLVNAFGNLATGIGSAIAGTANANQVFQQFVKDTLNAVLVTAPRLLGLNLLKEALTTPPPASWAMIAGGVALLGISGLAGGLISQIGQQPETIATQASTGTGLTGAATSQAQAQGLAAANNAPQTITQVTVLLNSNGIIKELEAQQILNGQLKGL